MDDDRPTISHSRLPATEVAHRRFGIVRRGFDPDEVRAHLELLAKELATAERREQELLHQLTAAEDRARHPVIDEALLSSALGQRSAAVLRGAHEEAARIAQHAEESAASVLREATQHAAETEVQAESSAAERIAEAELEANALRAQARDEAAAMLEAARTEGDGLLERTREHGRAMLEQAQEARRRVLADMAHRRRLVTEQIEQFRAARDEIAGSVVGVRHSVDRIIDELARADEAARAAAADAARRDTIDSPEALLVAEAEQAAAELGVDSGASLAASEEVLSRLPDPPSATLRFDDIATVVERPAAAHAEEATAAPTEAAPTEAAPAGASRDPIASDVEGLFARLRAQRAEDDGGRSPLRPGERTSGSDGEPDAAASAHVGTARSLDVVTEDRPVDDQSSEPSPDGAALARRASVLDPIVTTMARRLKRALQDDQNALLDRLRQGPGTWSDDLLPDEGSQRSLYAKASSGAIRDSMAAGAAFARSVVGARGRAPAPDQRAVNAVTDELTGTVVALLRRRLEGGEIPDAAERIGAAYREWRGERIERLAEDRAVEAFGAGVLAGSGRNLGVRWVRNENGPGCADCEDNALAGAVAPGDAFPTGHRHPPAHAGCRCLVVPASE